MKRIGSFFKNSFFKNYWLAILAGVLMGTSYIPFPPWALAFCFAPLWIQAIERSATWKSAFWAGWWTQFVLTLIGFHWIAYVSHEFGYMPWPLAILTLLLFASTVHTYFAVASTLGWFLRHRWKVPLGISLFAMASLVSLAEAWWPSLFPWNLGYPLLSSKAPWAQWADIIGFWGISFLIHQLNAFFAWIWMSKTRPKKTFALLGILLLALHLGGERHSQKWKESAEQLNILQVQGNIGNLEKIYAERGAGFEQEIATQYFQLTEQALLQHPETDLIVWPESAFPDFLDAWSSERQVAKLFRSFILKIKKPILTGAYSSDPPGKVPKNEFNGLFLFDENAIQQEPVYHKTYLLAFGEYTPGLDLLPQLARFSPAGTGFGRGPGPTVIPFRNTVLGLQICYESLYPNFTSSLAKKGADILVNLTNDSWFGPTFEPEQHMWMTLARALESRRPLVRNTNTGITTAILPSGEVLEKSPSFQPWFHLFKVKYHSKAPLTFYTRFGHFFPWFVLTILVFLILAFAERRIKS